jgi:hypothetical protein
LLANQFDAIMASSKHRSKYESTLQANNMKKKRGSRDPTADEELEV